MIERGPWSIDEEPEEMPEVVTMYYKCEESSPWATYTTKKMSE